MRDNVMETSKATLRYNRIRRRLYKTDTEYAEGKRRAARECYRRDNPLKTSQLLDGLLSPGVQKEVTYGEGHILTTTVYSLPEAAIALGRAELTFKKWVSDGLIPEPILFDTTWGHRHYSLGELQVIATVLVGHEREFTYYTARHEDTRIRMENDMATYRARYV